MKKILAIFLLMTTLLAVLVGCSSSPGAETTPKELTPIEKARNRAVAIGEQYLNFEISADEARELLEDIKVPEAGHKTGALCLRVNINHLIYILGRPETTYEEIQEDVEDMATLDFDVLD